MSMKRHQGVANLAELANSKEVLDLLECPICNEVPLPPIYTCQSGHAVCLSCLNKMDKCGLCQKPFTTARNYFMESIILSSKHHCPFKSAGCQELIRGDSLENHIQTCFFGNPKPEKEGEDITIKAEDISGCCKWIRSHKDNPIPKTAVEGGIENGSRLYVARCPHAGGIIPGKLDSKTRLLSFSFSGKECVKAEYEVLVSVPDTLIWVGATNGQLPENAVISGRTDIGEALYLGRCGHQGTLAVGWVLPSKKTILVASQGMEYIYTKYEILVKNSKGVQLDLDS